MTIRESLINEVNSAFITYENHSSDNSFIDNELYHFEGNLKIKPYEPYGICRNIPYNPYDSDMVAYVFKEDDEIKWVHMPKRCWKQLLSDMYGREKAKQIVG